SAVSSSAVLDRGEGLNFVAGEERIFLSAGISVRELIKDVVEMQKTDAITTCSDENMRENSSNVLELKSNGPTSFIGKETLKSRSVQNPNKLRRRNSHSKCC